MTACADSKTTPAAGTSIAGLYTLVSTCDACGINPFAYLAEDHPKRRLDELLPGAWARSRRRVAHVTDPATMRQRYSSSTNSTLPPS